MNDPTVFKRGVGNDLVISMGITDNFVKCWVSYHYGTSLGKILGSLDTKTPQESPRIFVTFRFYFSISLFRNIRPTYFPDRGMRTHLTHLVCLLYATVMTPTNVLIHAVNIASRKLVVSIFTHACRPDGGFLFYTTSRTVANLEKMCSCV